ncbi:MAG: transcriptional activator of acetoin/glycerol metabolism [Sporomusa sp.]|nr:transcriptional activator of acetoin/glycerol metabolism [Sporomusa sp.]
MVSLLKNFISGINMNIIDKVPPPILKSWERCRGLNINHERITSDDILQPNRLRELLDINEQLTLAAKPVLQHIFTFLQRNHYQIMLSNEEGYILVTLGNPPFISKTEKIFLTPGVNWQERLKGTNGIGTVLIEQRPLSIPGWSHYSLPVNFLDCWASPIRSSTGQLVGVLNISGEVGTNHKHLMEITTLGASMIEQNLHILQIKSKFNHFKNDLDILGNVLLNNSLSSKANNVTNTLNPILFSSIAFNSEHFTECEQTPWYGRSQKARSTMEIALRAARTDSTVLIQGESGTGKEIIAKSIHNSSVRKDKSFVTLNCASIPNSLVESELFGYAEGSFTGAKRGGQPGKFELASGGTIFLDEIGDMPFNIQASLLRVLQQKEFYRIGDSKCRVMDARVIAATNQDLRQLVDQGKFRLDLYYRLKVIYIEIPPLRERIEDIGDLVPHFVTKFCAKFGLQQMDISPDLLQHLCNCRWPGNIRQLENCIENMIALSNGETVLTIEDLPDEYKDNLQELSVNSGNKLSLQNNDMERKTIMQALKDSNGNVAAAARQLGIGRTTIYRKINKLGISMF